MGYPASSTMHGRVDVAFYERPFGILIVRLYEKSMKNLELGLQVSNDTRSLALRAVKELSSSHAARDIADVRAVRPVDYMRHAEFSAILRDLELNSGMTILDVASPQWFSLYLANKYPSVEFHYINIVDSELDPYKELAEALGIKNLRYRKEDVRDMQFSDNTFDRVISISVIEHIYPEEDGDLNALSEIYRVLKSGGEFLLTVPYKSKSNILYIDGPVYERKEKTRNFFAREYDEEMFNKLIERSYFSLMRSWFICERRGMFPVDYYEWGPGKNVFLARYLVQSRKLLERIFRISLDEALAKKYLSVSREITGRLVNISARLTKA
jgi:ubiquinone/menaquinone biosynthesis C-methylase UbiE